ncbi:hypothetical protein L2331_10150 [Mesorhizobium muleiense]|uniref:hypothetical protein n=1 Tax=unclassified Mesorhizobium TaxID=325217 RepID=UPI000FD3E4CD|nr:MULTISPECIES: hypothetical protein [Mesorhizobium]MCF6110267.1 hypothetical protein [Mesorhizobium muleiense]RVD12949.1 hypothetical protein EN749_25420 [Mesorhizobium sp. M7A.F.Ca.ET.027.02.1.1]RWD12481.1 MAG: hypothetical protein EOS73_04190 [Mesorhizobium sp.]RWE50951.1 MAG: hypothetical protein EOS24_33710 [Mesorhizobium sp.]TGS82029.1 hypothetical protein EN818_29305 [Mesorhizobium sp. M3A.F.Ca.ET.175.01.1.1]
MTDDKMALIELLRSRPLATSCGTCWHLRPSGSWNRTREARRAKARSPLREVQRNGYRDWDWDTRAAWIALDILEAAQGKLLPECRCRLNAPQKCRLNLPRIARSPVSRSALRKTGGA